MEFFKEGEKYKKVLAILGEKQKTVINVLVLTELKYKLSKKFGAGFADNALHFIETFDNILIAPVVKDVAKLGADLRLKYYSERNRDMSYIDAINLATAILTRCDRFYTGDPDFSDIEEIKVINI